MTRLPKRLLEIIGRYREASKAAITSRDAADRPTGTSWHYTSMEGLRGILQSDAFWLHSVYSMNDDTELTYGYGLAKGRMAARILDAVQRGHEATGRFLYAPSRADWLQKVRQRFEFYSISFGPKDDEKQWKTYGDNGRGAAIGLAPTAFANIKGRNPTREERTFVSRVTYGPEPCTTRHEIEVTRAIDLLGEAEVRGLLSNPELAEHFMHVLSAEMSIALVLNSITTKSESWEHEQELRMMIPNDLKAPASKVLQRQDVRTGEKRDYVVVPAGSRKPGALVEVMVGADAPAGAESDVESMLDEFGMKGVIVHRAMKK